MTIGGPRDSGLMQLAIDASEAVRGTTYPNPPVGAVIVDVSGEVVGVGSTEPTGGPHAEIVALGKAGDRARGGTAYVTLEPCSHTGRTGPCSMALLDAGVSRLVYAVSDPNPLAAGGAQVLWNAGLDIDSHVEADAVERGPLRAWLFKQRHGRPHITWKFAASLDGRSAAADGTSKWISGPESRAWVHQERAKIDALVVGTGTVLADDPALTARLPDGSLANHQPLRVAMGRRDIDSNAQIRGDDDLFRQVRSHEPAEVLAELQTCTDVWLEGGPTLAGAFIEAGLVDRIVAFIAPIVLGAGRNALGDAGIGTIDDARRFTPDDVRQFGTDVMISLTPNV